MIDPGNQFEHLLAKRMKKQTWNDYVTAACDRILGKYGENQPTLLIQYIWFLTAFDKFEVPVMGSLYYYTKNLLEKGYLILQKQTNRTAERLAFRLFGVP